MAIGCHLEFLLNQLPGSLETWDKPWRISLFGRLILICSLHLFFAPHLFVLSCLPKVTVPTMSAWFRWQTLALVSLGKKACRWVDVVHPNTINSTFSAKGSLLHRHISVAEWGCLPLAQEWVTGHLSIHLFRDSSLGEYYGIFLGNFNLLVQF